MDLNHSTAEATNCALLSDCMIWIKMTSDELLQVLRMMVRVNISDKQLGFIADRTIQEADQDGDSAISFTEFVKVLEKVDVEQKMSIRFLH